MRRLSAFANDVLAKWRDDHAASRGAALAYFTLFSLAPLVMLTIAVVGRVLGRAAVQGEIVARIHANVGPDVASTLEGMLASIVSPTSGSLAAAVSVATMVLGASSAVGELQNSLNVIFHAPAVQSGGLRLALRRRLAALLLIGCAAAVLMASMLMSALLSAAHGAVMRRLPSVGPLLAPLNSCASVLAAVILFAAIYRVLPDIRLSWHDTLFGAVVTAGLFAVGRSLLGLYLRRAGVTSAYGAAGSLVFLLLWIYYSSLIVFVGAEVTSVYAKRRNAAAAARRASCTV